MMKKSIVWLLSVLSVISFGYHVEAAQPSSSQQASYRMAKLPYGTGTRWTLDNCLALLRQDDKGAREFFNGGEKNLAPDGKSLIGRTYFVRIFGEDRKAYSLYGEDGRVDAITIPLKNPDASVYLSSLERIYGKADVIKNRPGEGGSTYHAWKLPGALLRLYQNYGSSALEIVCVRVNLLYSDPSGNQNWLPKGTKEVKAETQPLSVLENAIRKYYGISGDAKEKTRYQYNYVDLDGDGKKEIFAVVSGPYTSGTGGDSALWGQIENGTFKVRQAFTLMRTPILVKENSGSGEKNLILRRSGGGAPAEIVEMSLRNGQFVPISSAGSVKPDEVLQGTAILCGGKSFELRQ
ncbi:MAG: hypothetical protein LKE33_05475 [Acidaminococcus sp.]|jgi:hypothetical protein|nr:hypothetical protein [Acidaminococcus sp.]MCI2101126.1 hypothetical protein [Acidaminococcus sp.]MCI2115523.1 hypothetical protein [Acidaminococcus sp.]MCI2117655.1 hypothetical protein [Acidaminococcus sp.]